MSLPFFDISKISIYENNPVYQTLFDINFSFKSYDISYEDMILNCFKYDLTSNKIYLYFHYNENFNITNYIKSFYNLEYITIEQHNKFGKIFKTIKLSMLKFSDFKFTQNHNNHNDLCSIIFELSYINFNEQ